ncbi:MAG: citrate/2-methylcitrate synthase [Lautropia sp.]
MQLLNVRRQTLYAYVSRGWIRSIPQDGQKARLYLRDDLTRVSARSAARAGHGAVAASAMNLGEPILPTSITEITPQGPRYRGKLAADLVREGVSFEGVAELLWTGSSAMQARWPVAQPDAQLSRLLQMLPATQVRDNILETCSLVILMQGMRRGSVAERLQQGRTLPAAREIMHTVVGCCGFLGPAQAFLPMHGGDSIVTGLIKALGIRDSTENREGLRAILILMADHELPPGTLGARVVASAGGSLHSCLASALCATSGIEVGRMYEQVESFLRRPLSRTILLNRALKLHAQHARVPGFDHPVYPKGDPRAAQLLAIAHARKERSREMRAVFRFLQDVEASTGLLPRQELAVVVLTRAMDLPPQVPAALFALGRISGWVAHVREQRSAGIMLRPRARFVDAPAAGPIAEAR